MAGTSYFFDKPEEKKVDGKTQTVQGNSNNPSGGNKTQLDAKNNFDKNKADNKSKKRKGERCTADMIIVGYPHLKSKKCVTVMNVGGGSGMWYVKEAVHSWSAQQGYLTKAKLIREMDGEE